jgi:hypothetical protein
MDLPHNFLSREPSPILSATSQTGNRLLRNASSIANRTTPPVRLPIFLRPAKVAIYSSKLWNTITFRLNAFRWSPKLSRLRTFMSFSRAPDREELSYRSGFRGERRRIQRRRNSIATDLNRCSCVFFAPLADRSVLATGSLLPEGTSGPVTDFVH